MYLSTKSQESPLVKLKRFVVKLTQNIFANREFKINYERNKHELVILKGQVVFIDIDLKKIDLEKSNVLRDKYYCFIRDW